MENKERRTIQRQNAALSKWAMSFIGTKPKRTRRLSLAEAMQAARKARLRYRVLGRYGD